MILAIVVHRSTNISTNFDHMCFFLFFFFFFTKNNLLPKDRIRELDRLDDKERRIVLRTIEMP